MQWQHPLHRLVHTRKHISACGHAPSRRGHSHTVAALAASARGCRQLQGPGPCRAAVQAQAGAPDSPRAGPVIFINVAGTMRTMEHGELRPWLIQDTNSCVVPQRCEVCGCACTLCGMVPTRCGHASFSASCNQGIRGSADGGAPPIGGLQAGLAHTSIGHSCLKASAPCLI